MHFAICVWGIARSLSFTVDSIHKYCLDPIINAGHTYEIYMHTYNFSGVYVNERSHEMGVQLNFSEWQILKPDHIFIENQDEFDRSTDYKAYHTMGDPWHNEFVSFQNHLRAMNSLNYLAHVVEKESKKKHFDGIMYLRPDVTYLNELPFYLLEHVRNTLFLPDFHRSCRGGEYNDRMAMGDLRSGLIYGKKFEGALEYSKTHLLHSEKFMHDYLVMNNVTVKEIPFRFRRTRAKGEFHVRDGTAIVSPQKQKPHQEYQTNFLLRWIYTLIEMVTDHSVYVWNHDDDENLYCKPHPYLSRKQVQQYRKLSRRNVNGTLVMLAPEVSCDNSGGNDLVNTDLYHNGGGGAYSLPPRPRTQPTITHVTYTTHVPSKLIVRVPPTTLTLHSTSAVNSASNTSTSTGTLTITTTDTNDTNTTNTNTNDNHTANVTLSHHHNGTHHSIHVHLAHTENGANVSEKPRLNARRTTHHKHLRSVHNNV